MKKYPVRQELNLGLPDLATFMAPADRTRFSIFASLLIHTLVILGLGFTATSGLTRPSEPLILELTLSKPSGETPEDAQLLAQHNQLGSGTQAKQDQSNNPLPTVSPHSSPGIGFVATDQAPAEAARSEPLLLDRTTRHQKLTLVAIEQSSVSESAKAEYARALALISQYAGEVDELKQRSSDLSRHTFISSSTRESRYAAYVEAWRNRVEKVGNHNYPELARQRNLSGELLMAVAIDPDGLVRSIRVVRSSGIKILDDAAIHITALAAPFEPLPDEIKRDTDVLHITRTWQFLENARLISH